MVTWMLSSDSHIFEPADLWTSRVPARYRNDAPRVETDDEADWWFFLGQRMGSADVGTKAGLRFQGQEALRVHYHYSDVREGAFTPDVFVEDNAHDGVWGSVIFPSVGVLLYQFRDERLLATLAHAYNEWLAEFCSYDPMRLKGMAIIDAENPRAAIGELEVAKRSGLAGAVVSVAPLPGHGYDHPQYEEFWEAAADLGMPLALHIATNRDPAEIGLLYDEAGVTNCDGSVRNALARMIFSGVFERHPRLQVGAVEFETGWVAHFLERMDYTYAQREHRDHWGTFADGVVPSDFFRRNVFVSFQEDPVGIYCRHLIGVDTLLWGSDYPHTESTFPRSREIVDGILDGVPDDERLRILQTNTAGVYGFEPPSA
jgi:predicted TIM-barrel fold metal-dependent hydrolase